MINSILMLLLLLILIKILMQYNKFIPSYNISQLPLSLSTNKSNNLFKALNLNINKCDSPNYDNDLIETVDLLDVPIFILNKEIQILYSNTTFNNIVYSLFNTTVSKDTLFNLKQFNITDSLSDAFVSINENNRRIEVERNFDLDFLHINFTFIITLLKNGHYLVEIKNSHLINFLSHSDELFSSIKSPVIIERNGKIEFANKSTCDFFNIELDLLKNKPFSNFYKKVENNNIFLLKSQNKENTNDLYFTIIKHKINEFTYYFLKKTNKNLISPEDVSNFLSQKKILGFTSDIVHDLKTPLNIIYSVCQIFDRKLSLNSFPIDKQKEYIEIIESNCFRQLKLINNIVDIDKLDNNLYKQDKYFYKLDKILASLVDSVKKYASVKFINLQYEQNISNAIAYIDITSFERIILNLISNSIKFTPNGGKCTVSLDIKDNKITISISDNGIGIKENKIKYLFEKYSDITKNDITSSGLGLHIVKCLTNLNDGNIYVESNYLNGSCFTIEFPLVTNVPESFKVKDSYSYIKDNSTINSSTIEFSDI